MFTSQMSAEPQQPAATILATAHMGLETKNGFETNVLWGEAKQWLLQELTESDGYDVLVEELYLTICTRFPNYKLTRTVVARWIFHLLLDELFNEHFTPSQYYEYEKGD